jgi:hypothetical protein
MRALIGIVLVILLVGCKAHTPPDDAVAKQINAAVTVTLSMMAIPQDQQPSEQTLASQSRLLACRLSPERVGLIQAGTLDRIAVIEGYQSALKRRAAKGSVAQPPTMLVHLIDHQQKWSIDQTMLAAALLAQFEDEAKLNLPTTDLAR